MEVIILGIESSCDDTSAAIVKNGVLLSNVIANQDVHKKFGGVVPELASRAHQQNIIPVVDVAVKESGIMIEDINAVAFTRGPGLMGALLVGTSFAKGFALSRELPLIEVNHLHAHILSHFIIKENEHIQTPAFPYLCLLVSGGHSQIIVVKNFLKYKIIGNTIDDAAGEAFDKTAKIMGLPYPGGPLIDKYAQNGDPDAFEFGKPRISGLDYSFSGLKTSVLYFLRDRIKEDENFIQKNINDICASVQSSIIDILMNKLMIAVNKTKIKEVTIAGGVSANSGLRNALSENGKRFGWNVYLPKKEYTTDNAAMIAFTGYHKYMVSEFSDHSLAPYARISKLK